MGLEDVGLEDVEREVNEINADYDEKYGFHTATKYVSRTPKGLSENVIRSISKLKREPEWMLETRLKAYKIFLSKPTPTWGVDLSKLDFNEFTYYLKPRGKKTGSWNEVPKEIKETFDKLGIPEAEKKFLAGVGAQFESEVLYHSLKKNLEEQGVIFLSADEGLKQHPLLFKKYFGTIVPANDNKFAALNTACWSGGSFIYVPKNVKVEIPLQAYFRINEEMVGQFERTLIIADEGSQVSYVEGCSAPVYSKNSLHAAVVELIALKNAKIRYTTIQNWSSNVYNLVTKRAHAFENAVVEWIDCNLGSKATMKYPCVVLKGNGARADILSVSFANAGQHQDAGGKVLHLASNTSSRIISKSVSKKSGRTSFRGLVLVAPNAENVKSTVSCEALLLDEESSSDTYPTIKNHSRTAQIVHEAFAGKIDENKLFYLQSRGVTQEEAMALIVLGFISELTKELPMEYALELNKLVRLEIANPVC